MRRERAGSGGWGSVLFMVVLSACGGDPGPSGPGDRKETPAERPSGYTLIARHSGQCVDVSGASQAAAARVIQSACDTVPSQRFDFEGIGNGYYRVRAQHSGLCLEVLGSSQGSGAAIIQSPCHGGDSQVFFLSYKDDGFYSIQAKHSGQCLDVFGGETTLGSVLIQFPCHGGPNQQFRLD